jgi:hypothetical protein
MHNMNLNSSWLPNAQYELDTRVNYYGHNNEFELGLVVMCVKRRLPKCFF